jgi:DEAD/DEAH box helicase domain-containing protein
MLPTVISREVEEGIKSFLRTTFPSSTPIFEHTLEAFLGEPGQVFKGPYYSLRLPFRPAPPQPLPFTSIETFPFNPPHLHQAGALVRLCGDSPRSTLVATGTGSGKTECFLYPILDACATHAGELGIKAIIIYPMNALATDQAKRFAQAIHAHPKLRGSVLAGLFIGGEGDQSVEMKPDWVITSRSHLREHPPDILLTNYKMLDFLLLRPEEQPLWRYNVPETLRFLVVDELHTFDGAQSTDLACLIRRLKARLRTPENHLCCVGTSATLGSLESVGPLVDYARMVFSESFDEESVIGEELLGLGDLVGGYFIRYHGVPEAEALAAPPNDLARNPETHLAAQYRLWFEQDPPKGFAETEGRIALGERLREHSFFRNLLLLVERSGRKVISEEWLIHEVGQMVSATGDAGHTRRLLDSFLALCAHARYRDPRAKKTDNPGPLLRVHVHLWTRELSRLVASVAEPPRMAFSDDLKGEALKIHLPVIHCRECGVMGWGGTMRANADKVSADLQEFYKAFFGHHPTLRFFFPVSDRDGTGPAEGEFTHRLCGSCLRVEAARASKCSGCGETARFVNVLLHDRTRRTQDETQADTACPYCESASGLTILGSRAASLTSVALSQLYTSPFNQEKQALAFSDNVQDASHRSGFFAARTFRVNLRTAIHRVIAGASAPLTLADLESRFLDFWRKELGDLDFIGIFLAPNMEWLSDYESLRKEGRLPAGSNLLKLVERRVAWEITAEFGFNSRIGRTLEKSGAAIAFADPQRVGPLADKLVTLLRERAGGFGGLKTEDARALLAGLVHRLRTGGGIYHPELEVYVQRRGDTYLLNQQVHMPTFGKFVRAPAFFYQGSGKFQRFEKLVAGGTSMSWSQRWVIKTLRSIPNLSAESASIALEGAVRVLVETGIFVEQSLQGDRVWGIPTSQLVVTNEVRLMTCGHCGYSISCTPSEEAVWAGSPCLRAACRGTYAPQPAIQDYFGDLYRSGDVVRIRSAEHTGLLDRDVREWVENRFMARPPDRRATDPNLLSCTPTLEMGVNIGDLSSVVLCTVPPATSNYVQRVGRAGRKEGAAVSLTIASAQPHDLYYFELPEDMMAGDIRPPGTFLDAPAVLERQFTAFCFDRWSEQTNPKPILPHTIDAVLDAVRNPEGKSGFPYDFFKFIECNLEPLLARFLLLFKPEELTPESRQTLERFGRGDAGGEGGLTHKILTRLAGLAEDREDLRNRLQKVGRAIRKNRGVAARDEALDAELDELKQSRDGIYEMLKQINGKLTLNFFTDEGLLPNYAFPEEGVELRSVILKKREQPKAEEGKYQAITFEYVRPAASAITEFAPGNVFYVEGRRLKIDQVVVNESTLQKWHFCDSCSYMELVRESAAGPSECPSCQSPNWTDASLKRDLVRLRQVVSTSFDRNSRSHDDKDERELAFYSRHESVVIPEDAERQAYQIRGADVPFGFEFLGKLTLRVVNLGQDSPEIHAFRLGGKEISSGGFALCPDCGRVQTRKTARGEEEMKHDLSCRHRGKDAAPLKAVFLYRELHSEAIRVLLPSSSANEDADMASFVAALHLGLRLHFRGSIEHLRSCVDERTVPGTSLRRKYLVLYDQVPGGTGYLKQLSQKPEIFLEVLRLALAHLKDCQCATRADHQTDGCHRCILQSRHARDHAGLSRTTAIRLLETILQHADQLERVNKVSDIDIHPLIQSELEKSFLESLRVAPGAQLQAKIVRGKPGYLWRCADAAWEVGLQVDVAVAPGIEVPSVPDFVFYPVRAETSRPIAVFLDGFAFHADEAANRNRIARDVQQRQALVRSGKFWVWSLSWEDIQFRNDRARIPATLLGEAGATHRNELARQILAGDDLALAQSTATCSSWDLFLEFLACPAKTFWARISYLYALALPTQLRSVALEAATETVRQLCQGIAGEAGLPENQPGDGLGALFGAEQSAGVTLTTLAGVKERNPNGVFVLFRFDDDSELLDPGFARHWRGFLRLLNRLQFLPHAHVITVRGAKTGAFPGITDAYRYFLAGGASAAPGPEVQPQGVAGLPSEFNLAHTSVMPLLEQVVRKQLRWPVIGFELESGGLITATAEAAWPDARLAVVSLEMAADQETFLRAGWQVFRFGAEGLAPRDTSSILSILPSQP